MCILACARGQVLPQQACGGQRATSAVTSHLSPFWGRGLSLVTVVYARIVDLRASGESRLHPEYRHTLLPPGLHGFWASALRVSPLLESSQFHSFLMGRGLSFYPTLQLPTPLQLKPERAV